jgi:PhnB protein
MPSSSGDSLMAPANSCTPRFGIDDTVVMLADPVPPDWPPIASYVHIYVKDVDATYRKALDAGAASVQEPIKKQDEDKRGGVKDAGGTTWWISTKVE